MPYVLFYTVDNNRELRDEYKVRKDTHPIMLEADELAKREDVVSWGVAKIEAASEFDWKHGWTD
jgi:hypothetical protein